MPSVSMRRVQAHGTKLSGHSQSTYATSEDSRGFSCGLCKALFRVNEPWAKIKGSGDPGDLTKGRAQTFSIAPTGWISPRTWVDLAKLRRQLRKSKPCIGALGLAGGRGTKSFRDAPTTLRIHTMFILNRLEPDALVRLRTETYSANRMQRGVSARTQVKLYRF